MIGKQDHARSCCCGTATSVIPDVALAAEQNAVVEHTAHKKDLTDNDDDGLLPHLR